MAWSVHNSTWHLAGRQKHYRIRLASFSDEKWHAVQFVVEQKHFEKLQNQLAKLFIQFSNIHARNFVKRQLMQHGWNGRWNHCFACKAIDIGGTCDTRKSSKSMRWRLLILLGHRDETASKEIRNPWYIVGVVVDNSMAIRKWNQYKGKDGRISNRLSSWRRNSKMLTVAWLTQRVYEHTRELLILMLCVVRIQTPNPNRF